jgi:serine/threonine protein kinase
MSEPGWIGRTIGERYQIQELIGQGGMSAVYKAYDPNLRRVVAIKLIHSHLSQDPQFVRRFEEEAASVAQMRHPSIIQVYDFNIEGNTYFIIFEFVPGESLRERLQRTIEANRSLELTKIVDYSSTVAGALDYAHNLGIIHRDIKPANVMINVHDQAILMDFGIVKIVGGDTHTATGAVLGTARYISPEQVRGESVDSRTDIYSMGVMLYEMSSGRPPYEADSAITVMMMHVNDPIPDIRSVRPDLPASLANVITRAMAKNRSNRYQSAAELAQASRSIKSDPAISAVAGVSTVAAAAAKRVDQPAQSARPAAAAA